MGSGSTRLRPYGISYQTRADGVIVMPGFFDLFFRPTEPEPDLPKPKKVKKAKKAKKAKKPKEDTSLVDSLRAEIVELREMVTTPEPEPEPEPEPVVEAEEPEDDESS